VSRPSAERPERGAEDWSAPEFDQELELALERWENEGGAAPPPAPALAKPNQELELALERWEDDGGPAPAPAPAPGPERRRPRERASAVAAQEGARR
jgi:hypothetical protein